jgi:hypothetical protein
LLEEREGLRKVADTELILRVFSRVLHSEVEPLLVPLRVRVYFAEQIVLLNHSLIAGSLLGKVHLVDRLSLHSLQISTFNSGVELEVLWVLQSIVFLVLR